MREGRHAAGRLPGWHLTPKLGLINIIRNNNNNVKAVKNPAHLHVCIDYNVYLLLQRTRLVCAPMTDREQNFWDFFCKRVCMLI